MESGLERAQEASWYEQKAMMQRTYEQQARMTPYLRVSKTQPVSANQDLTSKAYSSSAYFTDLIELVSPYTSPALQPSVLNKPLASNGMKQTMDELVVRGMGGNAQESLELRRRFAEFEVEKTRKEKTKVESAPATSDHAEDPMAKFLNAAKSHGISIRKT